MLIAYLTTDEVNEDLANRMADDCGVAVAVLSLRDLLSNGRLEAVIYDIDYVPPNLRDEILTRLLSGAGSVPAAVLSYNLTDRQAESLRRQGVAVYRRLDRAVFVNFSSCKNGQCR